MAKKAAPKERQMSPAEAAARARTLKERPGAREAFDIGEDYVRETVRVDSLPDPPGTEAAEPQVAARSRRASPAPKVNADEAAMNILREEAQEIGTRLALFGIAFGPQMQQDMVDHVYSLLAMQAQGFIAGGGAIARR
jgi:hypothetical protein